MLKYTTEDLLLYLYQETSPEQNEKIKEALEADWDLKEKFDVLVHSVNTLDKMIESPRVESVNAILNYARMTSPVEQP